MDLVSGYDSDSDDEVAQPTAKLVQQSTPPSSSSSSILSKLGLPAPSSTSLLSSTKSTLKRKPEKRQIRIDTLDSVASQEDENITSKRPKKELGANPSMSGLQGLMGMLPAPKQNGPPPTLEKSSSGLTATGVSSDSEGRMRLENSMSSSELKKTKGNNDFRAMLGLKPSNLPSKASSTLTAASDSIAASFPTSATVIAKNNVESLSGKSGEKHTTPLRDKDCATSNFFTFEAPSSSSSSDKLRSSFSISTAPLVEEEEGDEESRAKVASVLEEEKYKGWQQGPDGNWFPVTPEAHAIYSEYIKNQALQDNFTTNRPADMQFGDISDIRSVDANASRQAWQSRPLTEVDSTSTNLDRKYAMAAASIAMPDQGIPLVDQEEEVKKMDKKTNLRARRKGQLSALIAQAEENREKLEERWSKGKDGRNAAKEKYGF